MSLESVSPLTPMDDKGNSALALAIATNQLDQAEEIAMALPPDTNLDTCLFTNHLDGKTDLLSLLVVEGRLTAGKETAATWPQRARVMTEVVRYHAAPLVAAGILEETRSDAYYLAVKAAVKEGLCIRASHDLLNAYQFGNISADEVHAYLQKGADARYFLKSSGDCVITLATRRGDIETLRVIARVPGISLCAFIDPATGSSLLDLATDNWALTQFLTTQQCVRINTSKKDAPKKPDIAEAIAFTPPAGSGFFKPNKSLVKKTEGLWRDRKKTDEELITSYEANPAFATLAEKDQNKLLTSAAFNNRTALFIHLYEKYRLSYPHIHTGYDGRQSPLSITFMFGKVGIARYLIGKLTPEEVLDYRYAAIKGEDAPSTKFNLLEVVIVSCLSNLQKDSATLRELLTLLAPFHLSSIRKLIEISNLDYPSIHKKFTRYLLNPALLPPAPWNKSTTLRIDDFHNVDQLLVDAPVIAPMTGPGGGAGSGMSSETTYAAPGDYSCGFGL